MTTDLQARLLELNKLHAGAVLNKSAAGDHNHLAAANRALFKAWPDIRDEIARLTAMVERLEIDREASGVALRDMHSKWETSAKNEAKADALADAVRPVYELRHDLPETVEMDNLWAALTDWEGK